MAFPRNPALALRYLATKAFPGLSVDEEKFRALAAYCEDRGPTERELTLLKHCRGGCSTHYGSKLHDEFEALADAGWVKESTLIDGGVAWRLSGSGCMYAYDDLGEP